MTLINEFRAIVRYPAYRDAYLKILRGEQRNIRNRFVNENLSTEEQVTCLLDVAQDKAVLGITYGGMQPWI